MSRVFVQINVDKKKNIGNKTKSNFFKCPGLVRDLLYMYIDLVSFLFFVLFNKMFLLPIGNFDYSCRLFFRYQTHTQSFYLKAKDEVVIPHGNRACYSTTGTKTKS